MIHWSYESPGAFKSGQAVGSASHGQYWRGWEGDPSGATWFAIYKPTGGAPVVLIEGVKASPMYQRCTEHDQEQLRP
ncbi:MAG: hypothetical protein JO045_06155 [Mycobacterium sp.]|nr:hypothetical protein [Mycobacterium sp.]